MPFSDQPSGYLTGNFLIAMPSMTDPRFEKTVIYICNHNQDGAMGLIVNRLMDSLDFDQLLDQLEIQRGPGINPVNVHYGGPVEMGRGFVLHSMDYSRPDTVALDNSMGMTATIDILKDLAEGRGPDRHLLVLGYAGWGPGQLDDEMQDNAWLSTPAHLDIIFGDDLSAKWSDALAALGIDVTLLSTEVGHA